MVLSQRSRFKSSNSTLVARGVFVHTVFCTWFKSYVLKLFTMADKKIQSPEKSDNVKGLGAVVVRNEFYRDGYRTLLRLTLVQTVTIILLVVAMFYVISIHQPEDRYFATTEDGRLIPMVSLNQPNLSAAALTSWVAQASTEVMTFGFNDYKRRLQESSRHFTRRGWQSFTKALEGSRMIETISANQQVITAAPRGAPIIVSEGLVNGRYEWNVVFPLNVTFQSGDREQRQNYEIRAKIVRVPRLESPNGVGIEQWIAR